jgi:acyl carrier protein
MDKLEIEEKLGEILSRHSGVDKAALTPEKNLKLDLGLDSLDVAEIVYELEEAFAITIPDDSAERLLSISDTVEFIQHKIQAGPAKDRSLEHNQA